MRIPPFYVHQGFSDKSCSDRSTFASPDHRAGQFLYDTETKCKNAGGSWDYFPPYGWEDYDVQQHITDEQPHDYYYTGIHKMTHSRGTHLPMNYKGEWVATQATTTSEAYHKGDLVFVKPEAQGTYHPETIFYYCLTDNSDFSAPPSSNWEKQNLKSYLYEGADSALDPGAFHAYDALEGKVSHRYQEGGNATAAEAEMGVTNVKVGRNAFETWYNQENDPNQFYIADVETFNTYETCHGTRPVWLQGYSGNNNFYNATYPAGYYAPPYGEVPTLTLMGANPGDETINALTSTDFELENFMVGGCCPKLSTKDEVEMWGIRTVFPKKGAIAMQTFDHKRGDEHGVHAPYVECPPQNPPDVYFERELFGYHPGSIMAPGAGTFYNDNPFPNALDIDGWFHPHVYETQTCYAPGGIIYNGYKLNGGYPKLTYPVMGSNERKLDAGICKAREAETSQLLGYNFEGVQGGMGTGPGAAQNDQASFATYDPFIYWHFIFKDNHNELWNKSQNTKTGKVVQWEGEYETAEEGTIEDHMWEYRQCPNTPDFLPWSADCPIHACPSHYFDIPYYAAIGKFGFYGARFFNTCSVPASMKDNEVQDPHAEFNYYTASKASADGTHFNDPPVTMKGRSDRTAQADFVGRINGNCYKVTYERTSTDDEPVDLVLSSTAPTWEDSTKTIDLVYYVYEWSTMIGLNLGNLRQLEGVEGTVTWDTVSINMTACEECANGGAAAVAIARQEIQDKWAAFFGTGWNHVSEMIRETELNETFCDENSEACLPFLKYGSVAFNPDNVNHGLSACDDSLRTHSVRFGADDIHATEGKFSTFDAKVDLVRDFPAGVMDCDEYSEPSVTAGTCGHAHYETLLEIASNEQRINEFFVGNHGFFLWANYDHVINSYEYKNLLVAEDPGDPSEVHFKRCLWRLYRDFNEMLLSLPNFFDGNDDPVIYYEKASNGMYGNQALDYSRMGLFNDMLFSNNRYRQFVREVEWNDSKNLFNWSVKDPEDPAKLTIIEAWDKILETYGHYIANNGGAVNQGWYKQAIEAREKRVLTRYVENKLRGKAIDLFPTNQISFSTDSADRYITGKYWGNSQWGKSTIGHYPGSSTIFPDPADAPDGKLTAARFDPLPGVEGHDGGAKGDEPNPGVTRQYFHGVYAAKSSVTGHFEDITNAKNGGGEHFYAGLFVDWSCGGDMPSTKYTAGGVALVSDGRAIPTKPWVTKGSNDVGRVNQGFSCFSPIFIQQPLGLTCKIGQRPTFMAHAVDYHTIPEDKIGKGYPEIDYWTNNLKLTNSRGEPKYPIQYQWYRILRKEPDPVNRDAKPPSQASFDPRNMNGTFDEWFYANEPILQKASVTGEWACLEGVSGVGAEDCTMFHPQVSYTHDMIEGKNAGVPAYGDLSRKYREEHWSNIVDYKGEVHRIGSAKKQGWDRLWKSWAYLQGAISENGKQEVDPYEGGGDVKPSENGGFLDYRSSIPCFNKDAKGMAYVDMLKDEYGIDSTYGDEDYLYFCVASGRFGFRRSEYAPLHIEDWLKLDVSIRNGAPMSVPLNAISFGYSRVDQDHDLFIIEDAENLKKQSEPGAGGYTINEVGDQTLSNTVGDTQLVCPQTHSNMVHEYGSVELSMGWGAPEGDHIEWQLPEAGTIPPYAGSMRDPNQVAESEVLETMNMSNNCRSYAFVGREGFRGATRTYRPPTTNNHDGTQATRAGWFEYGLLYSFGGGLTQAGGNALYSQPQLPVCRDFFMPKGCTAQRFTCGFAIADATAASQYSEVVLDDCGKPTRGTNTNSLRDLITDQAIGTEDTISEYSFSKHYTSADRAVIITSIYAGVPTKQIRHHGELYPWNEQDSFYWYDTEGVVAHHGRGVSWQFSNNLGGIKRFGRCLPLPKIMTTKGMERWSGWGANREAQASLGQFADTQDVFFWAWGNMGEIKHGFDSAKRLIGPSTLAGLNCGYHENGIGRYMLYFVEALHTYYNTCSQNGKKNTRNLSFIAPGLRHGSSSTNFFWGGYPSSTYVKRRTKTGPYAYEWRVATHNRDRNGNGISESFYSTKSNRNMYLYDPPAIYGLWARQTTHTVTAPKILTLRKLRRRAESLPQHINGGKTMNGHNGIPYNFRGLRFGPYGAGVQGGCGTMRLGCVKTEHLPRRRAYSSDTDERCNWYNYAIKMGLDHGSHYGCNEKQLLEGVCFDPCLSMKYNYGFFPGGKLLTVNNYVKYKDSRHDAEPPKGVATTSGGVLPNANLSPSKTPSKSTLNANKSPQAQAAQEKAGIEAAVVKAPNPSRFLTQLTNDVHDEEIAITKSKKMRFVRILRGPWATPYRRIKAEMAKQFDAVGANRTSSDVVNGTHTLSIHSLSIGQQYYGEEAALGKTAYMNMPDGKTSSHRYTDTSVSPCSTSGADHCNYLTPTIHIGMDTHFDYMVGDFMKGAAMLQGHYTVSEEITLGGELGAQWTAFSAWLIQFGLTFLPIGRAYRGIMTAKAILAELVLHVAIGACLDYYSEVHCGEGGVGDDMLSSITEGIKGLFPSMPPTKLEQELLLRARDNGAGLVLEATLGTLDHLNQNNEAGISPALVII